MSAAILTTVLGALLRANLAGSAAVLLILLLRHPVRIRFGALAAYALWLAAPLFVLAALMPPHAPPEVLAPAITLVASAARGLEPLARKPVVAEGLAMLWAIGTLAAAGLFAWRQMRFVRLLGRLEPLDGVSGVLRGQHTGAGPFVLGSLRPKIVTPADFEDRFDGEARDLVLAHEGVHLKRGDAAINGLVTLVQCLAWFNPLVHLAARWLRVDQEIACDAAVVARHPQARRLYAETLLGAALAPWSAPFGCHWPPVGPHSLKERLTMLNLVPVSPLRLKLGLGVAGLIAVAGAGAVWAASPAAPRVVGKPNWVQTPTGEELKNFYPKEAEKANLTAMVVMDCRVKRDGHLRACAVTKEDPAAYGFGEAALKMSPSFRMTAQDGDGHPTAGAVVHIPIKFVLAD